MNLPLGVEIVREPLDHLEECHSRGAATCLVYSLESSGMTCEPNIECFHCAV